jgi:hypothetical protein
MTSTPRLAFEEEAAAATASGVGTSALAAPLSSSGAAGGGVFDPSLPSPASTVASLTRDLEQTLSLQSAMRGQFVVKPQVKKEGRNGHEL